MIRVVCLVFFLLGVPMPLSWNIVGQALADEDHQTASTLTVSEEGSVRLVPTKAAVNLSVETTGESLEVVQEENREKMERVLSSLQKLGIKKEHVQTSSLSVTPHYPPRHRGQSSQPIIPDVPKITGYTVSHSLVVEVLDLTRVGRVVDRALKAGANRFSHITWGLRDSRPAQLDALQRAARQAREKAKALAQALNVQLLQLRSVMERGGTPIPQRSTRGRAMMSMAMEDAGSVPVSPGELSIRASVTLVYEIGE